MCFGFIWTSFSTNSIYLRPLLLLFFTATRGEEKRLRWTQHVVKTKETLLYWTSWWIRISHNWRLSTEIVFIKKKQQRNENLFMLTKVILSKALFEEEIRGRGLELNETQSFTYLFIRMMPLLRVVDYLSFFIGSLSLVDEWFVVEALNVTRA